MSDRRTYIKLHDGMPEHPKVDGLSDKAFRTLIETWCWCKRNLTDGHVPTATWRKRAPQKVARELIGAGLVEETEGGVQMHDFLEHQTSRAEVEQTSAARSAAGKRGGRPRKTAAPAKPGETKLLSNEEAKPKARKTQSIEVREVLPPKPPADAGGGVSDELPLGLAPAPPPARSKPDPLEGFGDFYAAYPRREDRRAAERAWRSAIGRNVDPQHMIAAARAFAARCRDAGTERRFIKQPATWLNAGAYDNERPVAADVPTSFEEIRAAVAHQRAGDLLGRSFVPRSQPPSDLTPPQQWFRDRAVEFIDDNEAAIRAALTKRQAG
ncbi:MAG: hypothetical protein L0I76_16265 [Pseudonocardia sp.]|nr:hypothetical protein [Pseudonocardia sp.]